MTNVRLVSYRSENDKFYLYFILVKGTRLIDPADSIHFSD